MCLITHNSISVISESHPPVLKAQRFPFSHVSQQHLSLQRLQQQLLHLKMLTHHSVYGMIDWGIFLQKFVSYTQQM